MIVLIIFQLLKISVSRLTQSETSKRMTTQKSAISRIENHASDVKLSTLDSFAKALGKRLEVRIV